MRAVAREAAFEQSEAVDRERLRREAAGAVEEAGDLAGPAALPARQRDMRVEGAALGREAGRLARALDLGGERGERRLRFDAGPQRAGAALLEAAGAVDPDLEAGGTDRGERRCKVLGDRP